MTWSLVRASLAICSFAAFTTCKDLSTDLSRSRPRSRPYELEDNTDLEWEFCADSGVYKLHLVAYGFGAKNILSNIASYGCKITVVPSTNLSLEVLHLKPDGMLSSTGPGGQFAIPYAVKIVQDLAGKALGFGICMCHQQLGQALGGSAFKTVSTMETIQCAIQSTCTLAA